MSPALVQALQRLLVIAVVGALSAVGLNLTILNGALGNEAVLLIPILTAIIDSILKYLGGATVPAEGPTLGVTNNPRFPHFWSV